MGVQHRVDVGHLLGRDVLQQCKANRCSAWGFGQVEPAEFYKFETQQAKQLGYYIHGLPRRTKVGNTTVLLGSLTDNQSVKVASSALRHYYHTVSKSKKGALYAYGGVNYKGNSPLTKQKRINIINGWLACEEHLKTLPDIIHWVGIEDHIIKALRMAKDFSKNVEQEFRTILFPKGISGYPDWLRPYLGVLTGSTSFLRTGTTGREVESLQRVVNYHLSGVALATDGIFGPKTRAHVLQFQRDSNLQRDGIVGPRTKERLTA
ncbi:MAG: hypothetical protein CMJ64_08995 [Planctomycetaceae bacterium]|nr:hypothetical protein [Planctomycetaceae bacterium]